MKFLHSDLASIGKKLRMSSSALRTSFIDQSRLSRVQENTSARNNNEINIQERSLNNSKGDILGSLFNNSSTSFCFNNRRNSKLTNSSRQFFTSVILEDQEKEKGLSYKDLVKEIDRLKIVIKGLKNENQDFKVLFKNKEKDVEKYRKCYFELKKEIGDYGRMESEANSKKKDNFRLKEENENLRKTVRDLTKTLTDVRSQLTDANLQIKNQRFNKKISEGKIDYLENRLSSQRKKSRVNSIESKLSKTAIYEKNPSKRFMTLDSIRERETQKPKKVSFGRKLSNKRYRPSSKKQAARKMNLVDRRLQNDTHIKISNSFSANLKNFKSDSSLILGRNYTRKYFLKKI